jgi:Flp pilus assembly protein TadD
MLRILSFLLLAVVLGSAASAASADELVEIQRLQAAGNPAAALQQAERARALNPRDAQIRFLRGVLLTELKRDDEALEAFQRMNEDYPELADPLNNIAALQAAQGQLEAARASLEAALRNDPAHRAARENLADVYLRLALQLWEGLAAGQPADAQLARKLRLARELVRVPG